MERHLHLASDFNKEGCDYGRRTRQQGDLTRLFTWAATALGAPLLLGLLATIAGTASKVTTIEALLQEVNHRLERLEKAIDERK